MSETLERRLARGRLAREDALEIFGRVLLAVAGLHARGECHGLLSPSSILLDAGDAPLLLHPERGAALARQVAAGAPAAPALLDYLAPEARRAGRVDRQSDVYGLGLLLFLLLAGELPQPGDRLSSVAPDLAPAIGAAFERCYARREKRPSDASALLAELAPALGLPAEPPASAVAAESLVQLDRLLDEIESELQRAPDLIQALLPLFGVAAALLLWPVFNWVSLAALPLALLWRMMRGDVRQKARFFALLPRIERFGEEQGTPRLAVWQRIVEDPARRPRLYSWLDYAEPFFLPEELRKPPPRMGGVSRVPWS